MSKEQIWSISIRRVLKMIKSFARRVILLIVLVDCSWSMPIGIALPSHCSAMIVNSRVGMSSFEDIYCKARVYLRAATCYETRLKVRINKH